METLKKQAAKLLGEQKKYRRWLAVFLCLAMVVTAGTTAALKLNGQALSHEKKVLACSEEVHVHTAECYESGAVPAQDENDPDREQPICGYADYMVHVHNEDCCDENGELVCSLEEVKPHVHKEECFEEQKILVCGKEEAPAHEHTAECRELICGKEESEAPAHEHTAECRELACGMEEHQHTDACSAMAQGELICGNAEEGHEHTEECYEQTESIVCGTEEHTHTEECYSGYVCGHGEDTGSQEGHKHTEECYGAYTCGYGDEADSQEGHTHTEECYQVKKVAVCGELELHTHITEGADSCYDAQGNLICGIPELKEHQHSEECFEIIEVKDEDGKLYQKTYEDAEVKVIAEYKKEAAIPEDAQLVAERVEAEDASGESAVEGGTESAKPTGEISEAAEAREPAESGNGQETPESKADIQEAEGGEDVLAESGADASKEESGSEPAEPETVKEQVSYRLRFLLDGQEIEPQDTVSFVVHALDGEGGDTGELAMLIYKAGDGVDSMVVKLTVVKEIASGNGTEGKAPVADQTEGEAEGQRFQKVYEDAEIRVTAEYGADANIPEGAELIVERVEEEDDRQPQAESVSGEAPEESKENAGEASEEISEEGTVEELVEEGTEPGAEDKGNDTQESSQPDGSAQAESGSEPSESGAEPEETQTSRSGASQDSQASGNGEASSQDAGSGKPGVTLETVEKEVTYRVRFLVDGTEIEPEGAVKFTLQALDEEGGETGDPVEKVYNAGDGLDAMDVTLTREITVEVQHEFRQAAEVGGIRVIAEYDSAAKLPEDAKLRAALITAESDADTYAEYEALYLGQAGEYAPMDLLLDIGFYAGEEEVTAQAPVSLKVQIADSEYEAGGKVNVFRGGEAGAEMVKASVVAEEDGSKSVSFKDESLSVYMIGRQAPSLRKECSNEALNIIVIAEYGPEAELPEAAELKVTEITPESDPERYAQREAEYQEQVGEGAEMDMLLNIGFFLNGEEIEPKAPVSITIQMLDDKYQDGDQMNVVHFGDEATEKLEASDIVTDEDGNKVTNFEANSFSDYAVARSAKAAVVPEDGNEYLIYCEIDGIKYALSHIDDTLDAKRITINPDGSVNPEECEKEELKWEFKKVEGGEEQFKCHLFYNSNNYIWLDYFAIYPGQGNAIECFKKGEGYSIGGLTYSGTQLTNENSIGETAWKFMVLSDNSGLYRVNYYENGDSIENGFFQDVPQDQKGRLLGYEMLTPESTPDGKKLIQIPLTGVVKDVNIGRLSDYVGKKNGCIYKFYGWSLQKNANYMPTKDYMIYCGEKFDLFEGCTVPTYTGQTKLTLDVTNRDIKDAIDLYAIWAAPSQIGGINGKVVYYGTNYTELNEKLSDPSLTLDKNRKGRGVMFFVRLDGRIPNEPGPEGDPLLNRRHYTEHILATGENGKEERNPLNYWMHIYGATNIDAVSANLHYKPTNEDILKEIQRSEREDGKKVKVAGEPDINFQNMSLEEFESKYYVAWYVCKDGSGLDCWHIDGVLLKKTDLWNLTYARDDSVTESNFIATEQYELYEKGGVAIVHNTAIKKYIDGVEESVKSDIPPEKTTYVFDGWNTVQFPTPQNPGISFRAKGYSSLDGTEERDFADNDKISVDKDGKVYKNGQDTGLTVERNSNGVYEVVLYPQWKNGTNTLTIAKMNKEGKPLSGASFALRKCQLEEGVLQKGDYLTSGEEAGEKVQEDGVLTIPEFESNTYYCLEEITAPTGYERRKEIYFKVVAETDSANKKKSVIRLTDTNGELLTKEPDWLDISHSGENSGGFASIYFNFKDDEIKQDVSFKKTTEDGTPLSGAVFRLEKKNSNGDYIIQGTSDASEGDGSFKLYYTNDKGNRIKDKDGKDMQITTLTYGEYKLVETDPPTGYSKVTVFFEITDPSNQNGQYPYGMVVTNVEPGMAGHPVAELSKFSVKAEKSTSKGEDNVIVDRWSYELTVANVKSNHKVALRKMSVEGEQGQNYLQGVKFSLYKGEETDPIEGKDQLETDKDGIIELGELEGNVQYYLREVSTLEGYIRLTEPIVINVASTGVTATMGRQTITVSAEEVNGQQMQVLQIYNSRGIVLPETGGSGTTMYTLGGFAVIAASLMYGLSMRRKKEKGGCH